MTKYGCWNEPRPVNGAPVRHGHTGPVVAATVWNGSNAGEPLTCGKSLNGESLLDEQCSGCAHLVDHPQWPESDERMDIIGQNGGDGEHYENIPPL